MARARRPDAKTEALRQRGSLNPRPDRVADPLFAGSDFFDPRDLVQVKYEMVRRARVDGHPVSQSATAFGFSRPSFYQAQTLLARGGLAALVPQKPGPRPARDRGPVAAAARRRRVRPLDGAGPSDSGAIWPGGPSAQRRARSGSTGKKTPVITPAHPAEGEAAVVAYEQLRRQALAASPYGGDRGWVLLAREGVATWIDRSAGLGPAGPAAAGGPVMAGPPVVQPLHVGIVHVLATIALSRQAEAMSP